MRTRSKVAATILGAGLLTATLTGEHQKIGQSSCKFHRYFAALKSSGAPVSPLERIVFSFILANRPGPQDRTNCPPNIAD
jgi:hypothetical protein